MSKDIQRQELEQLIKTNEKLIADLIEANKKLRQVLRAAEGTRKWTAQQIIDANQGL